MWDALGYIKRALEHSGHRTDEKLSGQQYLDALEAFDKIEPVTQEQADEIMGVVITALAVMGRQN
jgi:hypothetical protein